MKHQILLALFCVFFLCACSAPVASAPESSIAAPVVPTETSSTPIAVYVPQPDATATTPKWDRTQISCEGKPFSMWGSPGTYLYQGDGGVFFTVVLKPGEAIPKMGVSIPDSLSVAGIADVTTGMGTFQATVLSGGRAYNILTGRLDHVQGTCQRSEWYVCGYGLVKLTSSDSGVTSPGDHSYSSHADFVLVSFTPLTTNEARIRYILAEVQLGNVADAYRANIADEETAEALRRWDAGVLVTNSESFERRIMNGRWYVVHAGTETPINGVAVTLSSDPER